MRGRRESGGVPKVMQWMRLKPAKVTRVISLAASRLLIEWGGGTYSLLRC